ncbi:MAG: arginase [Flavobacteriaceae bacterium]|nr:arginase [Flavobacteriaceae bacterium]
MYFQEFLQPLDFASLPKPKAQKNWLKNARLYVDEFPDLTGVKLAIFGTDDAAADHVRNQLYTLVQAYDIVIADLGNVARGESLSDTEYAISSIVSGLLDEGIIPVFIGADTQWTYPCYRGLEKMYSYMGYACLDAEIALWEKEGNPTYLNKIITHKPNYLFNVSQLGYQTYFTEADTIHVMQKMFFDLYRLGWVNSNMEETEPLFRSSDFMSINMNCVRLADAPAQNVGSPNGFFGDEICRLTRYAGMSSRINSLCITGYNPDKDYHGHSAMLIAQMIWYFVDGIMSRQRENPEESPDSFTKYIVGLNEKVDEIVFYKSNRSDRWWMEVPNPHNRNEHHGPYLVPCSYNDYLQATKEEIPDRWWNAYQKLM